MSRGWALVYLSEQFSEFCEENGFTAEWNAELMEISLEDTAGSYRFKDGISPSAFLRLLRNSPPRQQVEQLLEPAFPAISDDGQ